jgi:hypothetical protein
MKDKLSSKLLFVGLALSLLTAQGCAWVVVAAAGGIGGTMASGGGGSPGIVNTAPSVRIDNSTIGPKLLGPVSIGFTLSDSEGSATNIIAEFSLNGGAFQTATPTAGNIGTTKLTSSASGVMHSFQWDAARDLAPANEIENVIFRITASDVEQAELVDGDSSSAFRVGNSPPIITNINPIITGGSAEGAVVVRFTVSDTLSDPTTIAKYEFSIDNGQSFQDIATASIIGGVRPGIEITAAPTGVVVDFAWDTDLQPELAASVVLNAVKIRLTPRDTFNNTPFDGQSVENATSFSVDNNFKPQVLQLFDGIVDLSNPIIIPFALIDDDSDPTAVLIQWKEEKQSGFPAFDNVALNPFIDPTDPRFISASITDPAVRAAVLADPATRRNLQIITEVEGRSEESIALAGSTQEQIYAPDLTGSFAPLDFVGATVEVGAQSATVNSFALGKLLLTNPLPLPFNPGEKITLKINSQKQGRLLPASPNGVPHRAIWNSSADLFLRVNVAIKITPFDSRKGTSSESVRQGLLADGAATLSPREINQLGISGFDSADWNNDGRLDIVICVEDLSSIRVFLQDSNGDFTEAPQSPFSVEGKPRELVVSDFNGDGMVDVAYVRTDTSQEILIHHQSPSGLSLLSSATLQFNQPMLGAAGRMKKGDVNNDGRDDLILSVRDIGNPQSAGALHVFLQGNLDISAAPYSPLTLGIGPGLFDIGDLNNDSLLDVAVVNTGPAMGNSSVSVFLQDNSGVLARAPYSPLTAGQAATGIAIGDFNNDSRKDLAVAVAVADNDRILFFTQSDQGSLAAPATNSVLPLRGANPDDMTSGDMDGDGRDDLMLVMLGGGGLTFVLQQTSGQFSEPIGAPLAVPGNPFGTSSHLRMVDFDQDGRSELVASSPQGKLSIVERTRPGRLVEVPNSKFPSSQSPQVIEVIDLNQDGLQDVVYIGDRLDIKLQNAVGRFSFLFQGAPISGTGLAVGDLNSDNRVDIVTASNSTGEVFVLLQTSAGNFNPASPLALGAGSGAGAVAVGDYNGDNRLDLSIANLNSNNITVYLQNSAGQLVEAPFSPLAAGSEPRDVYTADLNNDGRHDIVTINRGSFDLTVYLQNSSGLPSLAPYSPLSVVDRPAGVEFGDIDNDGRQDIIVMSDQNPLLRMFFQEANGNLIEGSQSPFMLTNDFFSIPTLGDLNQDGLRDITLVRFNQNKLSVLSQNTPRMFTERSVDHFSPAGSIITQNIVIRDINGDSLADIVTLDINANQVSRILQKQ